jgi:DNA polymerase-3 subunit beta
MRVVAQQDALAKALATVSRVIAPQNSSPILTGVELQATEGRLTLTATDLFTLLTVEVAVTVDEPGSVVVPAGLLVELVQKLPTATVEITQSPTDARLALRYGRSRATLNTFGEERLPDFPPFASEEPPVALTAGAMTRAARQLLFACAKDETRPVLRGVAMTLGAGRLVMASTDGSRLSQTWIAVPDALGDPKDYILPAKAVAEMARLNASAESELAVSSQMIQCSFGHGRLLTRLVDGQYPDYQRVIPQEYIVQGKVSMSDFRGALERSLLIAAKERSAAIRIHHRVGELTLSASAQEYGQNEETIECDSHGQELELLFNPQFLLEALRSFEGDEVTFEFSGVQSPMRLRDNAYPQYSHIILPLRQLV